MLYKRVFVDIGREAGWAGRQIYAGFVAIAYFIHDYRDDIAALATVIIAIYTAILGKATIGLRDAAKQQSEDMIRSIKAAEASARATRRMAEAAIGATLADIHVTDIDLGGVAWLSNMKPGTWVIRVTLHNFGKGQGFLKEVTINAGIFRDEVPMFPQYRPDLSVDRPNVVPEGASVQIWQSAYDGIFGEDEVAEAADGNAILLVYGRITYSDHLGDEHGFGFSRVWDISANGFKFDDRPRYNVSYYSPADI